MRWRLHKYRLEGTRCLEGVHCQSIWCFGSVPAILGGLAAAPTGRDIPDQTQWLQVCLHMDIWAYGHLGICMHAYIHTYLHAGNVEVEVEADEVQYCRCGLVNIDGRPHKGLCQPTANAQTRGGGEMRRNADASGAWDGIALLGQGKRMEKRIALLGQANISAGAHLNPLIISSSYTLTLTLTLSLTLTLMQAPCAAMP